MIAVNTPLIGEREEEYVLRALRSGWISSAGPFVEEFEERWASYCDRRYGIAVSSGNAALQLAVEALRLEAGDEVIIPTFTIISCALAVVYAGGRPVPVDADPRNWTMDPAAVEAAITPRTRAIMAVHMYGHPVAANALQDIASRHGLALLEDAAEAHGAEYLSGHGSEARWRRCGSLGQISVFSFYANKPVTTGEGGMLLTDDESLARHARSGRNLCFAPGQRFVHEELGHNFRFTSLQAALGLAQIERIEDIVARKRAIAARYLERLAGLPGVQLPVQETWARSIYWMFGLVLEDAALPDAAGFATTLAARGIETRPFFRGMHAQPALLRRGLVEAGAFPVADHLTERGLYLPSGLGLSDAQIDTVCLAVEGALA